MSTFLETLNSRKGELLSTLIEHIQISFIALLIAALIGIPLGIILTKTKRTAEVVINIAAVLQTIPSLALLGLMIPLFGIGVVPAIIALVIYALLPILRNTYTGIAEVDESLTEAARGIGMKPMRRLIKVEIPIAMPVIMAGVRTAMVLIIGTATLAALIGAGGLGDLILLGIDRNNMALIIIGAVPAALLAIFFDILLRILQRLSYRKMLITLGSILLILLLIAVAPLLAGRGESITVAGKLGVEPSIITNMYKILIEEETDHMVDVEDGLGKTTFVFNALQSDEIDGYLEFTGTVLGELTQEELESREEEAVYEQAKTSLEEEYGMTLLEPMAFNNTYTLAVKEEFAEGHDLETISDLQAIEDEISAGFTLEFNDREEDGYPAIQEAYGLEFSDVSTMEPSLRYQAIESGDINLLDAYSTDAELEQFGMVILEDDENVFPPYNGAPMFKILFLEEHPEIMEPLNKLGGRSTDEEMQQMNYQVRVEDAVHYEVAETYLMEAGLIGE